MTLEDMHMIRHLVIATSIGAYVLLAGFTLGLLWEKINAISFNDEAGRDLLRFSVFCIWPLALMAYFGFWLSGKVKGSRLPRAKVLTKNHRKGGSTEGAE